MKTKESALRQMLLELALAADPTANRTGKDDKQQKDVPRAAVPVSPSLESPVQLSIQKPPIQDPDYEPSNKKELSNALSAIGEMISDEGQLSQQLDCDVHLQEARHNLNLQVSECSVNLGQRVKILRIQ